MKTIAAVLIIVVLPMGAWAKNYPDYGLEQKIYELEQNQMIQEVVNDQKQRAMKEKLDAIEWQRMFDQPNNSRSMEPPKPYTVFREVK
jgi:hypothetical protein